MILTIFSYYLLLKPSQHQAVVVAILLIIKLGKGDGRGINNPLLMF
jgi:hypothetical protein